jgi:integrase
MASVFRRNGTGPWLVEYFDQHGRRRQKSSRTTDKRAAERIAQKVEADVALRREGVVDARQDRFAEENRKPLAQHVREYIQHCRSRGLAPMGIVDKERHLNWIMEETGASRLADLRLEVVERALAAFRELGRSPRTVNTRRETLRAFGNWCRKTGRVENHPLEFLPKLDETHDRRRIRRPVTDQELERLLKVAAERGRRGWYLGAVLAGLRRSELTKLTWASVDLEAGLLTIRDGKAKREDVVPLHPELLAELKAGRPADAKPTDRVFPTAVTNLTRKHDFTRAGIPEVDEQGRVADLHGLRATLGTRLARAGIAPQVAQRIMRHADYRTTLKHYTMLSLADTTAAMHRLPGGGGTSAPRAQVSAAEVQAPVSGDGKTRPQQIPQHSEHDHERVGATTCDDAIESDDDDPGSKLAPSRDLRDKAPRRARLCSVRGARRKHDRFSLGNRRSILLSYGRAKGESNSAAAVCPGLRQRACEHGHRLRYTARSPVQGLNRNSISNPAVSPVLVIAR